MALEERSRPIHRDRALKRKERSTSMYLIAAREMMTRYALLTLLMTAALCLIVRPAGAQLSAAEIDALRARGEREGAIRAYGEAVASRFEFAEKKQAAERLDKLTGGDSGGE